MVTSRKPAAPDSWRTMLQLPIELKSELRARAREERQTTTEWIQDLVVNALSQEGSGDGGAGEKPPMDPSNLPHIVLPDLSPLAREDLIAEIEDTVYAMQEDFRYPVNRNGDQMDMRFMGPWISYHLARCGWRNIPSRRMIKGVQAKFIPPGCYEDLVEWMPVDTPEDVDPSTMTIEDLTGASASVQAEAIRRMGGHANPIVNNGRDPMEQIWKQPVNIEVDDPDFEQEAKEAEK